MSGSLQNAALRRGMMRASFFCSKYCTMVAPTYGFVSQKCEPSNLYRFLGKTLLEIWPRIALDMFFGHHVFEWR